MEAATTTETDMTANESARHPDDESDSMPSSPPPSDDEPTSVTDTKHTGIDINQAVSILSAHGRAKAEAKSMRRKPGAGTEGGNDGESEATDERRKMGQTIDLLRPRERARAGTPPPPPAPEASAQNDDVTKRRIEILESQSPPLLLRTLFQLQEERVLTYRRFDAGLDRVLQTGDLTQYPHLTVGVTAAFSVLSGSIKEVEGVFKERGGRGGAEVVEWIEKLQGLEREKLNYTAALHLEKMRGRNEGVEREIALRNSDGKGNGNERIAELLEESIVSLQDKVKGCVEGINEVLEELRYVAVEMEEEEEDK